MAGCINMLNQVARPNIKVYESPELGWNINIGLYLPLSLVLQLGCHLQSFELVVPLCASVEFLIVLLTFLSSVKKSSSN